MRAPETAPHRRAQVAVVDDDPMVRSLICESLLSSGEFEVIAQGADGHAAIKIAEELRPDIIVLDHAMPGLNGLEALPRILDGQTRTRVVMCTASSVEECARRLGACSVIRKPFTARQLIAALEAVQR